MNNATIASILGSLALLWAADSLTAGTPDKSSVRAPTAVQQKLTQNDGFEIGHGVALFGNIALVGAPKSNSNKGAAYVYTRTCASCSWTLSQRLTASDGASSDRFGDAVAFDGDTMLVGATNAAGS